MPRARSQLAKATESRASVLKYSSRDSTIYKKDIDSVNFKTITDPLESLRPRSGESQPDEVQRYMYVVMSFVARAVFNHSSLWQLQTAVRLIQHDQLGF
jgi:hypothetical protein